ncbi:hypothetical protein PMAYCL1PPCAC_32314, partial [Pristionchus mayeri]
VNGCAVRELTCTPGINPAAIIIFNGGGVVPAFTGPIGLPAIVQMTCNAAGTAWTYMGYDITNIRCN